MRVKVEFLKIEDENDPGLLAAAGLLQHDTLQQCVHLAESRPHKRCRLHRSDETLEIVEPREFEGDHLNCFMMMCMLLALLSFSALRPRIETGA